MDAVREEMTAVEVTEEDAEERTGWRGIIRCGDPSREQPKEEDDRYRDWHRCRLSPDIQSSLALPYIWPTALHSTQPANQDTTDGSEPV